MYSITSKFIVMSGDRKDAHEYSTINPDEERDIGAKGGPTTSLGIPDDAHDVPHPYDEDIQTQLAAKSTQNKKNKNDNDNEGKAS